MQTKDQFEEKILGEIRQIPLRNRAKLSEIIHYLRLGITLEEDYQAKNIKKFAGMWQDLKQEEVDELLSFYENRDSYFKERPFR